MTASSVNLPLDVVLPLVVAMVLALGLLCIADAVLTRRGLKTAQSVAAD